MEVACCGGATVLYALNRLTYPICLLLLPRTQDDAGTYGFVVGTTKLSGGVVASSRSTAEELVDTCKHEKQFRRNSPLQNSYDSFKKFGNI